MAANQVVLYFDRQEDAVRFTLAASSVMSADMSGEAPVHNSNTASTRDSTVEAAAASARWYAGLKVGID